MAAKNISVAVLACVQKALFVIYIADNKNHTVCKRVIYILKAACGNLLFCCSARITRMFGADGRLVPLGYLVGLVFSCSDDLC